MVNDSTTDFGEGILHKASSQGEAGETDGSAERISELEAAIAGLRTASGPRIDAVRATLAETSSEDKLAQLERRLDEQEQTLRHVLTMLIEWLEEDGPREAA